MSPIFTSEDLDVVKNASSTKNTSDVIQVNLGLYLNITETYCTTVMSLNCLDTLNCWIFLIVVVIKSHRLIGCCEIMSNLIRLPRLWTLIFCFGLNILGNLLEIFVPLPFLYKFTKVVCLTFVLSAFSMTILLAALNQTKIRDLVHDSTSLIFKGALSVFFFRLLVYLILTIFHLTIILYLIAGAKKTFWLKGGAFTNGVSNFLFLPFYKKGTELIWIKIFRDDKFILGKVNSTERQNSDLCHGIQAV